MVQSQPPPKANRAEELCGGGKTLIYIHTKSHVHIYPEVEFVNAVTAGGSVKFLPVV